MGMQVPYRICTKISETGNLQRHQGGCGTNIGDAVPQKRKRTAEEAAELGKKELYRQLSAEIPRNAEILSKSSAYLPLEGGKILVTAEFECKEDIALQSPIDKIENMNYDIGRENNPQQKKTDC